MAVTLTISGINRSSLLQVGSLRISKARGAAHTASFVLVDKRATPYYPQPGEHVLISEDGHRIFQGQVEVPTSEVWHGTDEAVETQISCSDYTRLLHRFLIEGVWRETTASTVLTDVFTPYNPYCDIAGRLDQFGEEAIPTEGIQYTPIDPGVSIGDYAVQDRSVFDVISELSTLSEFEWALSYDKTLRFSTKGTEPAPFVLSDTSRNFRKLTVKRPTDEYANDILVLGAVCETNPQFAQYAGDGTKKTFTPDNKQDNDTPVLFPILDVAINDQFPTGAQIIDTSLPESDPNRRRDVIAVLTGTVEGADVYFNGTDLTTKETLKSTEILRFRYTGEYPVFQRSTNLDAVKERYIIEGGGGLYQHVEQDGTIKDNTLALQKALSICNAKSVIPRVVNFETDMQVEPLCRGLAPGQIMQVQLTRYNLGRRDNPALPGAFTVERLDISDVGGQWLKYEIELVGSQKTSWVDSMRKALQPERVVKRAGDATVHMLRRVTERLSITDTQSHSYSDGIPWVGSARVGFCECVSGVELVQAFVSPGMWADYYIAR